MKKQKYKTKVFGGYFCIRVLKGKKLMGAGNNYSGQLGTGDKKNRSEFIPIPLPSGAQIVKFNGRFSSYTTIVLTTMGLLGTGFGGYGEFGDGTKNHRYKLTPLEFYKDMKVSNYFAEGWALWVFMENGEIMRSGRNYSGQLGNGTTSDILVPVKLNLNFLSEEKERIVNLSGETAFLSNEGRVYVCGYNKYGQLGLSHEKDLHSLKKLGFFDGKVVTNVVSGGYHLIFATKDSCVYSCGRNDYGQLGLGDKKDRSIPTKIALFGKKVIVEKICAGESHSLVLTMDQSIYSFGDNTSCQCGISKGGCILVPTQVKTSFKPLDIEVTAYSSVFVQQDGSLQTVGANDSGQCALGHFTSPVKKLTKTNFKIDVEMGDYQTSGPLKEQVKAKQRMARELNAQKMQIASLLKELKAKDDFLDKQERKYQTCMEEMEEKLLKNIHQMKQKDQVLMLKEEENVLRQKHFETLTEALKTKDILLDEQERKYKELTKKNLHHVQNIKVKDKELEEEIRKNALLQQQTKKCLKCSKENQPLSYKEDAESFLVDGIDESQLRKSTRIGSGSVCEVYKYKGKFRSGVMEVALKVLNPKLVKTGKLTDAMVVEEAMKMISTNHRNCIKCLGYCLKGEKGIFTELCKESLDDVIAMKKLGTFKNKVRILKQIADGMNYLHTERKIVHRDLKPNNVLLMEDGTCKIVDFGISKQIDLVKTSVLLTSFKGTPFYFAPEMLSKKEGTKFSELSDVFSFGVLCYCVYFEKRDVKELEKLFYGGYSIVDDQGKIRQLLEDENWKPKYPKGFDLSKCSSKVKKLLKMISNCLEVDPYDRMSFESILRIIKNRIE